MAVIGRDAAGRVVLESLTGGADCFLVSGGEAARDVDGGSVLRVHDATLDFL
jgi:hypothetical protein